MEFFNGLEPAGKVIEALLGSNEHPDYPAHRRRWKRRLLISGVKGLIAESRERDARRGRTEAVTIQFHDFEENVERMQYGTFRTTVSSSALGLSKPDAKQPFADGASNRA